jgi:hypothetical protein
MLLAVYGGVSGPTNASWNVDADGNWSQPTNWTPSAPNASGAVANFGTIITSARTVTVDSPQTTGQINFNNANKYTIAGTATLTLDNTSAPVGATVTTGSHDITAPLVLTKDATFTVTPAGSTLTASNLQSSSVGITKAGAGKLAVNNVRSGSLTVNAGTVAVLAGRSTARTSKVQSLTIASGATLDVADNDLIVDYTGSSPMTTVRSAIVSAYGGGSWRPDCWCVQRPQSAGGEGAVLPTSNRADANASPTRQIRAAEPRISQCPSRHFNRQFSAGSPSALASLPSRSARVGRTSAPDGTR